MLRRILFCAKRKTLYSTLTLTITLVFLFINNQVGQQNCFSCFCFHKIGSEGATALVARLSGRLRTSRIVANGVQVSAQETLAYEGVIIVFFRNQTQGFAGVPNLHTISRQLSKKDVEPRDVTDP